MMTSLFGHPISVWDVVSSFLYLVICVVGLLGNLLAIYVIVKYTRMKTVTNQYILNLSISDAIFLLDLPLIIVGGLLKRWIFGVVLCKVYFATTGINMFTGSFTLAVLSGDRYLAVCHPSKAVVYRTARNARIVILLTWVVSVLFLTPIIVYANIFPQVSPNITSSSPNSSTAFTPTLESMSRNSEQQHLKRFHRNIVATSQQQQQQQRQHQQSFTIERLFLKKQLLSSKELFHNESSAAEEKVLAEIIAKLKAALKDHGLKYKEMNSSVNLPRDVVKTFGVHSDEERLRKSMKYDRKRKAIKDEVSEVASTATSLTTSATSSSIDQSESQTRYTCTVNWPQDHVIPAVHAYIVYNMVIGFVMPVMVISILYTTLVVKLSKDPNQTKMEEGNKKASFVKTVKKTFLSKESSFGKKSDSFRARKSPSPKTPTIHENEILSYETPPEVMNRIGTRIFADGIEPTTAEGRSDRISMITRQITAASDSVVAARPPPPVVRNLSAFKQRKLQQPRITRLVTTIILVYVVCWLPYWAFQLHLLTNVYAIRDSRWKLTLYHIFTILSYCNSAINPILYVFTNQNFRDSFVGAVQCREDMGTRARRATDQFKDSVRMRNIAARNDSPKTATGTGLTRLKSNGSNKKNLQRFHSCSPNIIRSRGINDNNLDIAKPLNNNKTFEVNQHDNVDSKSLKPLIGKVADKTDDQIFETAELPPVINNNNNKPFPVNDECGLRPSNNNNSNNNNSPVVDCPISEVSNCVQTTDRLQDGN